jgi:5-methylcytosine-specific restriction protein A
VANLNDEIAPLFAEAEDEMVPLLVPLTVPDVALAMQAWAQAAKDSLQDDEPDISEPPPRTLFLSETLNGRGELSAGLDPEARELTDIALRAAETPDVEGEPPRSPAQRRADAFVDIMRFFLDHQTAKPGGRHRHHMNVIVRYEDLIEGRSGEFADGTRVDGATIQRLACDAGYHRVVTQGRSSILDYGTTRRNIPVNLFNALVVRDRGCRFPGCDRPPHWCEAHHIDHWENHGPTKIENLVLACSRHHHLLHMPGWHIRLRPDATVEVTTPAGQNLVDRPPGHTADLFADAACARRS